MVFFLFEEDQFDFWRKCITHRPLMVKSSDKGGTPFFFLEKHDVILAQ